MIMGIDGINNHCKSCVCISVYCTDLSFQPSAPASDIAEFPAATRPRITTPFAWPSVMSVPHLTLSTDLYLFPMPADDSGKMEVARDSYLIVGDTRYHLKSDNGAYILTVSRPAAGPSRDQGDTYSQLEARRSAICRLAS